jgi:hypothetical protein
MESQRITARISSAESFECPSKLMGKGILASQSFNFNTNIKKEEFLTNPEPRKDDMRISTEYKTFGGNSLAQILCRKRKFSEVER